MSKQAGEGQVTETELKGVTVGQEGPAGCGSEVTWKGKKSEGIQTDRRRVATNESEEVGMWLKGRTQR